MKIDFEIRKVDNHRLGMCMYKYAIQIFATYTVNGKKYPDVKYTKDAPATIVNNIISEFAATGELTGKNLNNLRGLFYGKVDLDKLNKEVVNYDE